jgi:hypothetical protein
LATRDARFTLRLTPLVAHSPFGEASGRFALGMRSGRSTASLPSSFTEAFVSQIGREATRNRSAAARNMERSTSRLPGESRRGRPSQTRGSAPPARALDASGCLSIGPRCRCQPSIECRAEASDRRRAV